MSFKRFDVVVVPFCTATVVPDNERWAHTPGSGEDLAKALAWATENPAVEGPPMGESDA